MLFKEQCRRIVNITFQHALNLIKLEIAEMKGHCNAQIWNSEPEQTIA